MNSGSIWWGQIGNSLRLLTKVTNNLRDCQSAVLQVPQNLPWRQDFYEAIDIRRSSFGGERRLVRLVWEDGVDPGEFVLDELCSNRVRADYWPGQTYAQYLASMEDILLNEYYVWITGIHSKSGISKWTDFVAQYIRHSTHLDQRAVFILEYDGINTDVSGVEKIVYSVENYDCRVFCLESAAAYNNTDMHVYQAELVLSIGNNDPELCDALLTLGEKLLQYPVKAASEALGRMGDDQFSEQAIVSAAWKASIVLLFPILEQHRMNFVAKHQLILSKHLPINNSNGDQVNDPYDLEVGSLHYIVTSATNEFQPSEIEDLRLCRRIRNLLAHNRIVPYADVRKLMCEGKEM